MLCAYAPTRPRTPESGASAVENLSQMTQSSLVARLSRVQSPDPASSPPPAPTRTTEPPLDLPSFLALRFHPPCLA